MMLKIKEEIECLATSVDFDEYVPITVEFESNSLLPPIYWRVGDGKLSLMEIGLTNHSGAIHSVTLVNIKADSVRRLSEEYKICVSEKEGAPTFDLSAWQSSKPANGFANNFLDDFHVDLELTIGKNFITISIADDMLPTRCIKNNNVIFGINEDGALTSIDIVNIHPKDIKILSSTV